MINVTTFTELKNNWYFHKGDLGGIWESCRPVKTGDPEDSIEWEKVSLPHCYNAFDSVDIRQPYYQGYAWYRIDIDPENPFPDGRYLLNFEGVGQVSEVYIDQELITQHSGGYDEWSVDITESLNKKKNSPVRISVRCNNKRDLQTIPSNLSDFNLYGGLYRPVNLIFQPQIYIDSFHITPGVCDGRGEISIQAKLNQDEENLEAILELKDPSGKIQLSKVLDISGKRIQLNSFIDEPQLWSCENPYLYSCSLTLLRKDESWKQVYKENIGFRSFHFQKQGPFFLNGERLLLKGTHRHEDHAATAAAMPSELIEEEMRLIKSMGINFIRLGHYQQSSQVLDLCDQLGILVWEEIPWCRGGLGGSSYQRMGKKMLKNMINQHYNHPSIILWGLGNENDWPGDFQDFDKEKIRTYMNELHDLSHEQDGERLTSIRRCDFCKDIPDVYSPSIWAGWYRGHYREYKESTLNHIKDVDHFLHVEWGASSHAGRFSEDPYEGLEELRTGVGTDERGSDASLYGGISRVSKDGNWSENYACDLFDWTLKEQETMPELSGTAFWPFKDFATPLRPENPIPYVNQKGVIERDMTPKESFYVFQSFWSKEPMVRIFGHKWTDRWGKEGELKEFRVYSNCAKVELLLDGTSLGIKKRDSQDFPAAGLRWKAELSQGIHILKAIAVNENLIDSTEFKYHSDGWGSPSAILGTVIKREGDEVSISIQIVDKEGKICLDCEEYVSFSLAGEGRLLENRGTSRGSTTVQLCNGKSGIRVNSKKGNSVLGVTCSQMKPLFIPIQD